MRWRIERDYQELKQELGLGIMRGEAGAAFTTMPACASQLTVFSSPNRRRFPPQQLPAANAARNLPFPAVPDPARLPLRPEQHMPNSIATLRRRLTAALVRRMPRCPCCASPIPRLSPSKNKRHTLAASSCLHQWPGMTRRLLFKPLEVTEVPIKLCKVVIS